jgi:hypothetical protein
MHQNHRNKNHKRIKQTHENAHKIKHPLTFLEGCNYYCYYYCYYYYCLINYREITYEMAASRRNPNVLSNKDRVLDSTD